MERTILHCDINNCYASIECMLNPSLKNTAMVVGGSEKDRHGIVLAKSELAKKYGIRTGEPLSKARQKCRNLIVVPPQYDKYVKYANLCKDIYYSYTNNVESFGLDEAWLDCSGSSELFGNGMQIAESIQKRVISEIGITVSIGVSFNKIFAKLGSDLKKPNAITQITKSDFREKIWNLDVSNLLYVGRATTKTLYSYGIHTIGDLANTDVLFLESILGKNGRKIHNYANGNDKSIVYDRLYKDPIKSIGRGTTFKKDLLNMNEISNGIYELSTRVSTALLTECFFASTIEVSLRDSDLHWYSYSQKLIRPINTTSEIAKASLSLIKNRCVPNRVRSISIRTSNFSDAKIGYQMHISDYIGNSYNINLADKMMYDTNKKYGENVIFKARHLFNNYMSMDIPEDFKMPSHYH